MSVDWVAIAEQVAMTLRNSQLLDDLSAEDRIWLAVSHDAPWDQLSRGEQCVLHAARWLSEIDFMLVYVDSDLRAEIEDLIFTALRDTPEAA